MNITTADIMSGTATFADVHPDTCSDVTLRNLKANALQAALIQQRIEKGEAGLDRDRQDANGAVTLLAVDLIKSMGGDILENGVELISNVVAFAKEEVAR